MYSFRSVRNLVIDVTRMPASTSATGLHWQTSQATSLINVVVEMSTAAGNAHQGSFGYAHLEFESQLTIDFRYIHGERKVRYILLFYCTALRSCPQNFSGGFMGGECF